MNGAVPPRKSQWGAGCRVVSGATLPLPTPVTPIHPPTQMPRTSWPTAATGWGGPSWWCALPPPGTPPACCCGTSIPRAPLSCWSCAWRPYWDGPPTPSACAGAPRLAGCCCTCGTPSPPEVGAGGGLIPWGWGHRAPLATVQRWCRECQGGILGCRVCCAAPWPGPRQRCFGVTGSAEGRCCQVATAPYPRSG